MEAAFCYAVRMQDENNTEDPIDCGCNDRCVCCTVDEKKAEPYRYEGWSGEVPLDTSPLSF